MNEKKIISFAKRFHIQYTFVLFCRIKEYTCKVSVLSLVLDRSIELQKGVEKITNTLSCN